MVRKLPSSQNCETSLVLVGQDLLIRMEFQDHYYNSDGFDGQAESHRHRHIMWRQAQRTSEIKRTNFEDWELHQILLELLMKKLVKTKKKINKSLILLFAEKNEKLVKTLKINKLLIGK